MSMSLYKSGVPIGNRPSNHTEKIMGTNEEPWMTRDSINWLYNYILNESNKSIKLLEYGCGSSTAYFLSLGIEVTSIEHHEMWFTDVNTKLDKNNIKMHWIPYLIKSKKEGNDEGTDGEYYDDYVNHINKLSTFDIIIIDGRCRSSCIKNSIHHLNDGGLFIVDNAERKQYKKAIDTYIPDSWKKHIFPTIVDTTIIWIKPFK